MRKRRLLALLIAAVLTVGPVPAGAALPEQEAQAQTLYELGLFKGIGTRPDGSADFALDVSADRNSAATMLIRLLGKESKAQAQLAAGTVRCPFSDVPAWAEANVAWLYENRYVNGTDTGKFAGSDPITAQQFAAMILRSLGYSEQNGDFTYAGALDFAVEVGLLTEGQRQAVSGQFLRGDMAAMCCRALELPMRDSVLTLKEKLDNDGVFSAVPAALAAPGTVKLTEKYKGGGSYNPWAIELATECAPVAVDLEGDGRLELLYSGLSLYCLEAATGKTLWSVNAGKDRSVKWEPFAGTGRTDLTLQVLDVDGDGALEICNVTTDFGTGHSCIALYDAQGYFKSGWPVYTDHPANSVQFIDFDGDGVSEMCVGLGTGSVDIPSIYVYGPDGQVKPGWPKSCGYGLYSDGMAAADLDGDGREELVFLYDDQFVCAFYGDGTPVPATGEMYAGLNWNGIAVCESIDYEQVCVDWARMYGGIAYASGDAILGETREFRNCMVGTYSGISVDDLDGDGQVELACTGLIVDGALLMRNGENTYNGVGRYFTTFILQTDRSRYVNEAKGFDWTQMPTDPGVIKTFDFDLNARNMPVTADVDGDGNKEILYSSADGKLHCWNLDGTEHGAWPFDLNPRNSTALTFATVPTCADLNGDGRDEVIFGTYVQSDQLEVRGTLYVLDGSGQVMAKVELPPNWGHTADDLVYGPNVCRAAPCVADLDGDGKPEIAITTFLCGVVVYDVD